MVKVEIALRTDFNGVQDGIAFGLIGFDGNYLVPAIGERITLYDGEEHTCEGIVRRVLNTGVVVVRLDWTTWKTVPSIPDIQIQSSSRSEFSPEGEDGSPTEGHTLVTIG